MTPQELKNRILQLAIQGKLVEQRAEEGTGRELLEKILAPKNAKDAEKGKGKSHAKSAKSAKCSGSQFSPISDDEKPFDIPDSWEWVRLGDVGSWSAGATPLRTQSDYYGGDIPWLKTGDLNDGYVTEIPETITELALSKTSVRLNPVGSVLMAMYGATIGKLGILQIPATTNQACCACIPGGAIYNKYLFYFLKARRKTFIKMGEGGAQPNISKEKIVKALIPLPPLAEQKRIVAKLEELLPLCERLKCGEGGLGMDNFEINRLGSQINMLRDVSSAYDFSRRFAALDDINRGMREKAERERKAEEATIELNEQTKIQNQLLREQNQRLNETIMQLKDQHGNKSLPSTANASYQFDVFVSHANDNKEEFVNALTAELSRLGISIWYDANILDWGDNWKLQIANGLKKCRFGIVVVSPEFLGREWTEKELNELLQRQNEAGEKVILPLLYKLTISDMKKQYPQLADFQARIIAPDDDVRDIVIDFARILIRALKG